MLITYPRKNAFMNIIESWQKAVLEKGLDPFVGRKLVSLATEAGFKVIQNEIQLKSYNGGNPESYIKAIGNLWGIFASKGPEHFGLSKDSPEWLKANGEASSVNTGDFMSEGYVSLVGRK